VERQRDRGGRFCPAPSASAHAADGGFTRLNKIFGGTLEALLGELTDEVWKKRRLALWPLHRLFAAKLQLESQKLGRLHDGNAADVSPPVASWQSHTNRTLKGLGAGAFCPLVAKSLN